jgi:DNA-binding NtrC family response regulator
MGSSLASTTCKTSWTTFIAPMPFADPGPGTGMTTASIGKDVAAGRACVALVSKTGAAHVGAFVNRGGHELHEFRDWHELQQGLLQATTDLVLFTEDVAAAAPPDLPVPAVLVTESRDCTSGAIAIPIASLESTLEVVLGLAVDLQRQARRCRELEQRVDGFRDGSAIVGKSPIIRRLQGTLSRAADTDVTVLIEGPQGSGKSLAARVIHCKSRRSKHPIETVDCGTAAAEAMTNLLNSARQTTIVLEHIERLPSSAQSVLVRHLKETAGMRPRIVATTSAHLPELVARGSFREDLYYRLHSFPMVMPSLRERSEDIAAIAEVILANSGSGRSPAISQSALTLLETLPWPGNVGQLEGILHRAQALAGGSTIEREHIVSAPPEAMGTSGPSPAATSTTSEVVEAELDEDAIRPFEVEEQMVLSRALRATKGNVRRAAQLLGIGRATLYRKIQQYRLRLQ